VWLFLDSYAAPERVLHSFPTRRSSDLGPVSSGEVEPKMATSGLSSAAARCIGPVSLVRSSLQNLMSWHSSISVVLPATLTMWLGSEEHTSELQSRFDLVCRLLLEKKKN